MIQIASARIQEAERIKGALAGLGIAVELAVSPEACASGGCGTTVEIWGRAQDLPAIQQFFEREKQRDLAGLDFDPALQGQVFDPSAESATCPACGHVFKTSSSECPDCGLSFAVPQDEGSSCS